MSSLLMAAIASAQATQKEGEEIVGAIKARVIQNEARHYVWSDPSQDSSLYDRILRQILSMRSETPALTGSWKPICGFTHHKDSWHRHNWSDQLTLKTSRLEFFSSSTRGDFLFREPSLGTLPDGGNWIGNDPPEYHGRYIWDGSGGLVFEANGWKDAVTCRRAGNYLFLLKDGCIDVLIKS